MGCVTCNSSNVQLPVDIQAAGEATWNALDCRNLGWQWNGELSDTRHREGKETSIRQKSNSQRVFNVVIGQGLLRGGWIKRGGRSWIWSALWSGAASQYSVMTERTREGTRTLQQACVAYLAFPPPYATSCAAGG